MQVACIAVRSTSRRQLGFCDLPESVASRGSVCGNGSEQTGHAVRSLSHNRPRAPRSKVKYRVRHGHRTLRTRAQERLRADNPTDLIGHASARDCHRTCTFSIVRQKPTGRAVFCTRKFDQRLAPAVERPKHLRLSRAGACQSRIVALNPDQHIVTVSAD